MPDEEMDDMDKLIREASNSYHPDYDDKAWEKMEVLLDKHLPQKEPDRRRPVIILLLLLLIAGSAFFAILYPWNKKAGTTRIAVENRPAKTSIQTMATKPVSDQAGLPQNTTKSKRAGSPKVMPGSSKNMPQKGSKQISPILPGGSFTITKGDNRIKDQDSVIEPDGIKDAGIKKNDKDKSVSGQEEQPAVKNVTGSQGLSQVAINDQPAGTSIQPVLSAGNVVPGANVDSNEIPAQSNPLQGNKKVVGKRKGKWTNNFAITLSAGPDLSFVDLEYAGKTKLNYGAGLSYTFINRFTLRSGFYVARKVYSAKPEDYHPPHGYWTNYVNLLDVDADCNVYEIPLTGTYNFRRTRKHNWMAGIGLSTFLMKRETYNYLYKNMQGQTMNREWTIRNSKNHYFSVLTISGGYQYHISNNISIIAEPYFKLPLKGIGFGEIKLNSAGLMITGAIKPFAK